MGQIPFASYFMQSDDYVAVLNHDGHIQLINDPLQKLLGPTRTNPSPQPFFDLFIAEDIQGALTAFKSLSEIGSRIQIEGQIKTTNGTLQLQWEIFRDTSSILAIAKSQTPKQISVNSASDEINFRQLADMLPQIMWRTDHTGKVTYYNHRWYELIGDTKKAPIESVHPDDRDECLKNWQISVHSGQMFEQQYRLWVTEAKEYRWFLARTIPVRSSSGEITEWIGTATDIHLQKLGTESLAYMAAIMESSEDAVIAADLNGKISSWNRSAQRLFQYTPEEIIGQSVFKLIPPHRQEEEHFIVSKIRNNERVEHFETERLRKDKSTIAVSLSVSSIRDLSGKTVGVAKIIRDITLERLGKSLLADKTSELEAILDNSPAIITVKDINGRFILTNKRFEDTFGYSGPSVLHKSEEDLRSPETAQQLKELDKYVLLNKRNLDLEISLEARGEMKDFLFTSFPIVSETGEIRAIGCMATDISAKKKEDRQKAELEVRARSAVESSRLKSEFLANMSHEIRTPLNGILGMTRLLQETSLNRTQRQYLQTINQSSDHLLSVINDILDLAKIEANKIEVEETHFTLAELTKSVERLLKFSAKNKGIRFVVKTNKDFKKELVGDYGRIRQILLNLANNAIKFTENGTVSILSSITPESDNISKLRLEVVDTGIGISKSDMAKIFAPFVQADNSRSRRHGGTGLGLVICQKLAHLMNGSIGVNSAPGVGSTFWVEIPLAVNATKRIASSKTAVRRIHSKNQKQLRVLIAEDNKINQLVICKMLQILGHHCTVVDNGLKAYQEIQNNIYDLIFMDCHMPVLDGISATQKIRALETASATIPIIALTADLMKGSKQRCMDAGMNAFLGKPIDVNQLSMAIEQLMLNQVPFTQVKKMNKAHVLNQHALKKLEILNSEGTSDIIEELITDFLSKSPRLLSHIRRHVQQSNFEAIFKDAHTLKSTAAIVGANIVSQNARALEHMSKRKNPSKSQLALLFDRLDKSFRSAVKPFKTYRSQRKKRNAKFAQKAS